jgi:hypothetical protein
MKPPCPKDLGNPAGYMSSRFATKLLRTDMVNNQNFRTLGVRSWVYGLEFGLVNLLIVQGIAPAMCRFV